MGIVREFDNLHTHLMLLLKYAPEKISYKFASASKSFRDLINLKTGILGAEPDPDKRECSMQAVLQEVKGTIEFLKYSSSKGIIIVPDTNSLLISSDPLRYAELAESNQFTIHLLPTVFAELDSLKINHRNETLREKAKAAIKRIKGWRKQGSLQTGVKCNRTITILASHEEPDVVGSLAWLDPEIKDDRIIASVLEIQVRNPAALVVLATSDINLQNKADAAMIEVAEID